MRRLITAGSALLIASGVVLVLPVTGPSTPDARPVEATVTELAMGSVHAPAADAVVDEPPTGAAPGVPIATRTLRISRPDVPEFSLVGVTWAFDPEVVDVAVRVRTRDAAGSWTAWTDIGIEDAGRDGTAPARLRGGTSPLWTGESSGVEAEVATRSGASPVDVRVDLVDPGTSAADDVPGTPEIRDTADAAEAMPDVYSRAQWGADERLRTWKPQYAGVLKAATIHHTAGANGYAAGDVAEILRGIYRYHAVSLGWGDIGYNVLVDRFGRLWEGRSGGLASTVIGAHAGGFNTGTFGVSMIGNYDVVDTTPAMVDSVAAIVAWKLSLYGVNPRGTTTLTSSGGGTSRYAAGQKVTLPTVFAHRQVGSTACPGRYGYARMGEIRQKVAGDYVDVTRITARYDSDAAARAVLGAVTTPPSRTAAGTGAYAHYTGGSLFYSAATGVRLVRGAIRTRWAAAGWERGGLGYPITDVLATAGGVGWYGRFQGGSIYWTRATGAQLLSGPIERLWRSAGAERGALGYPVQGVARHGDGRGQFAHFEKGSVLWSPETGAHAVSGPVRAAWRATGGTTGDLGYPTADVAATADGLGQIGHFEGGSLYWSSGTGALTVRGPVQELWSSTGGERGPLGTPTRSVAPTADGAGEYADFQRGTVYWSPATGARALSGPVLDEWRAGAAEVGDLGYPTTGVLPTADGTGRHALFQGGSIYWSPDSGAWTLLGPVSAAYRWTGASAGALGYPVSDSAATADGLGRSATFQKGAVYWSERTGAYALVGPVWEAWKDTGGESGDLGYPTTNVRATRDGVGRYARFERGSLWWSPDAEVQTLTGPVEAAWNATGGESGPLGGPTQGVTTAQDRVGKYARFRGGSIWWSPTTGARTMLGPIEQLWLSAGAERSPLGYPTRSVSPTYDGVGRYARLQRGDIYWSPRTGARMLSGPVLARWRATGAARGPLGYPTSSVAGTADRIGRQASFQGGAVYWSPTTGAHTVRGSFLEVWTRWGRAPGPLGYPTSETYRVPGGVAQDFQHGSIRRSDATGRTWAERG